MHTITHQVKKPCIMWQSHHKIKHFNICALVWDKYIIFVGYYCTIQRFWNNSASSMGNLSFGNKKVTLSNLKIVLHKNIFSEIFSTQINSSKSTTYSHQTIFLIIFKGNRTLCQCNPLFHFLSIPIDWENAIFGFLIPLRYFTTAYLINSPVYFCCHTVHLPCMSSTIFPACFLHERK